MTIEETGKRAKFAARRIAMLSPKDKTRILKEVSATLCASAKEIIEANEQDMDRAVKKNMSPALQDRLKLDEKRIKSMAESVEKVADLPDPTGKIISAKRLENGLYVAKKTVPIGVIGIIYEARPNVTSDSFSLCFKSGNSVILKGGSDAVFSNMAITKAIQKGLEKAGTGKDAVLLVESTSREQTRELMRCNEYIDCLIPRGSAGLIREVLMESTVPVIETGSGNCHVFVDESADLNMAADIIENAKTQRTGVCNACESLVIHSAIEKKFLPVLCQRLEKHHVEIRADEAARRIMPALCRAGDEDWGREYLDMILSLKTVDSIDEAIEHINKYSTGHSESIITSDFSNAEKFLNEIDSACVYVNASTRFTDGGEFGMGAEIGISTQKLHARGPLGLEALTSCKYEILGNGQVRP